MNLVVLLAAIRKVYKVIPEEKTWKGYPKGNLVFYANVGLMNGGKVFCKMLIFNLPECRFILPGIKIVSEIVFLFKDYPVSLFLLAFVSFPR